MGSSLKYVLFACAVAALATGANALVGGAAAIPGATGPVEATIDNELRFFSVYWIGFGALCFWVTQDLESRLTFVPAIALFFALGGIARLISIFSIGAPSAILIGAMILEFVMPVLLFKLHSDKKRQTQHE